MSDPTKHDGRSAFKVPQGLLGMLALVLVVELAIAGRRLDFTTIWADDWRCSAESATYRSKDYDLLCFGDSLVKFGVLPREVEAKTGLRTFNLAINAGTMPSAYFMLRRALDSGARPKAIVADFCTLMLVQDPKLAIRLYPELATTRDCFDLAWTARDSGFLSAALLGKLLPSYKCRFEIRASIKAALEGRRASPWPQHSGIWAKWMNQNGAQPMGPLPFNAVADPGMVASLSPTDWECDPINASYLEKFLALAASREIPVFWLIPPLNPALEARRALNKADKAYTRFVRLAIERHPEVVVLDARHSGYDNSVYIDALHLDDRGAKVLTGDLAALVSDRLKRPDPARDHRWVEMPAFDGRGGAVARAGGGGSTR
jgi:hypothetical protein